LLASEAVRKTDFIAWVLAALLFQSFASAGQGTMLHAADGLAHAVMHWDKEGHHHHDDGSFHEEDSDQSARHLNADCALCVAALTSSPAASLLPAVPATVHAFALPEVAPPILEGPRRPPRLDG
jgi:hypothetical protein